MLLEKETAQEQQAQKKDQGVHHDFDQTHSILLPERRLSLKRLKPAEGSNAYTMPEQILTFYRFLFAIWAILQIFTFAGAQTQEIEVEMQFEPGKPVRVQGKYGDAGRKNLSFLNSIAGSEGLAKRIANIALTDKAGNEVAFKKLQDGELFAGSAFAGWSYTVDLTPNNKTPVAHASWASDSVGLLMAADILPLPGKESRPVRLMLKLPVGWSALTTETRGPDGTIYLKEPDDAVIMIGRDLETERASAVEKGPGVDIGMSAKWHFTLTEAAGMASQIIGEYQKIFGGSAFKIVRVNIVPHPAANNPGTWQAETRGNTVTIVSTDMSFRTQSLQRLHEQLRHEIFHLWIPNGVNLSGNYDWFYEGFALYQSLKTAVALNRISFDNFLGTLSRAYSIDRRQKERASMLETSQNRWAGRNTELYARGMVIAFMFDAAMMEASGGKRQVGEIFREMFNRHASPAAPADANESILKLMNNHREIRPIIDRYITGNEPIDLAPTLAATGIEVAGSQEESFRVKAKLSSRQKTILDRLGYNNWRKSPKYLK